MKKLRLTMVTVLLSMLLSVPVFAFGPDGDGKGPGCCEKRAFKSLNLNDEQKAKIEALHLAYQKELKPVREKMVDKSIALRRMWLQPSPDKEKILNLQKEVRVLRDQFQDKVTDLRLEIRKVLTPEQQEKLVNSGWGRDLGFGPRGGMRGHHGDGPGICN